MIFVTVGTTLPFDDLIKKIDELVKSKSITEKVICQIGNGDYIPQNCEYFRFKPTIDEYIDSATLVICHGGTGSVLGAIANGKKFIAVANPRGAADHQAKFLNQVSQYIPILWTNNLESLAELIIQAKNYQYDNLQLPCLSDDIQDYLSNIK